METLKNSLKLDDGEYVSQVAFYLKDKLVKIKRLKNRFSISDIDNLRIESDKVICFVENAENTVRHKVTVAL